MLSSNDRSSQQHKSVRLVQSYRRRGGALAYVVAVVVMAGVAAGGWAAMNMGSLESGDAVDTHNVDRRSFLVELKEKGELKAARSVDIKSKVEGRATIISVVEEGTPIEQGDLLVELASDQLDEKITQEELKEATVSTSYQAAQTDLDIQRDKNASDIAKAQLDVELKTLELEKYLKGDWAQQLRDAEIAIEEAKIQLERRRADFDAAKKLVEREFITQVEFEENDFQYKKALWNLEKAEQAKMVLGQFTHKAELRKRESDRDEAKRELDRVRKNAESEEAKKVHNVDGKRKELEITRARLTKLRAQRENCKIFAPAPGFVVYYSGGGRFWSSDGSGQVKEGATVHERQVLMQLPDTSEMIVVVRIHEAKTSKIGVGQAAMVEVEGIPGRQFPGKVTKVAAVADTQNRWLNPDLKEYETEITLDPSDVVLKPGVTAYARILVNEVDEAISLPVQSVYGKGGRQFVFVANDRDVEPRQITLGSVSTEWAEVRDGLSEGERILLAFEEKHTRMIPDAPRKASRRAGMPGQGKPSGKPGGAMPKGKRGGPKGPQKARADQPSTSKSAAPTRG